MRGPDDAKSKSTQHEVWSHALKEYDTHDKDKIRVICRYCGTVYCQENSTKFKKHLAHRCPSAPPQVKVRMSLLIQKLKEKKSLRHGGGIAPLSSPAASASVAAAAAARHTAASTATPKACPGKFHKRTESKECSPHYNDQPASTDQAKCSPPQEYPTTSDHTDDSMEDDFDDDPYHHHPHAALQSQAHKTNQIPSAINEYRAQYEPTAPLITDALNKDSTLPTMPDYHIFMEDSDPQPTCFPDLGFILPFERVGGKIVSQQAASATDISDATDLVLYKLVAKGNLSMDTLDSATFHEFVRLLNPKYILPSKDIVLQKIIYGNPSTKGAMGNPVIDLPTSNTMFDLGFVRDADALRQGLDTSLDSSMDAPLGVGLFGDDFNLYDPDSANPPLVMMTGETGYHSANDTLNALHNI